MNQEVILRLTGRQKATLRSHLFPGDGLEAVSMLVCGRRRGRSRHCFSVVEVVLVPHECCERFEDRVTWPTDGLQPLLVRAAREGLAIVKVHMRRARRRLRVGGDGR